MDARQLGYFLAVVDHGGFGKAADQIHIAQPSLSQSIANLERGLGVELFHRVGRGVVLSDAGRRLVEPARQVLRDLETARDAARSVRELERGRLDMVSMPSPGIEPLTAMMSRFAERHPGIAMNVEGAFTADEVVAHVRTGASEIGLLGSAEDLRTAELRVVPVESQPLVLISPPGADLPPGDTVGREDFRGLRLIASQRGSIMRRFVDDLLADVDGVHLAAEIAHRTSILPLVLSGFGHAVMPAAWTPLAERTGAAVRRIEPAWHLHVSLVSRPDGLSPAARAFVAMAEDWPDS
ncbi:DNA-binding transcriptional regulator, LysR family [Glycomyces sambucus]|uniref:DNA-binding transcriptional regulator, LysR family n=1 Tax=Glycomyces sambucus TaxID=380244 RepID=A0A1G9FEG7_9ACTN|nr:LysR family transcriptional regulator [Glycomyces sambucus]SDK86737.1 DNA-binding transcriptional regulator, LysR family [Glycomyces sambucus]